LNVSPSPPKKTAVRKSGRKQYRQTGSGEVSPGANTSLN
jgi:hypothetical protein